MARDMDGTTDGTDREIEFKDGRPVQRKNDEDEEE